MKIFQEHLETAESRIKVADHLLTQTYSMLKDPKLLLVVTEKLYQAQLETINAYLEYEKQYQRAKNPEDILQKLSMFEKKAKKLSEHALMIRETKQLLETRQQSPIEFKKQDSIVICDSQYNVKKLTESWAKEKLDQTKKLIIGVQSLIKKDTK